LAQQFEHSPSPWRWTDLGVLSDANGEAIIDVDDWNVAPENAVLIELAPILFQALLDIRDRGQASPDTDSQKILAIATEALSKIRTSPAEN